MKEKRSDTIRVHIRFRDEIKEIIEKRKEGGIYKLSFSKLTLLLTKHKHWKKIIKPDLINYLADEDE